MAHVWTSDDLERWRRLVREARRTLADRATDGTWRKGSLADLRRAAAKAFRGVFPTRDPFEQAQLNAFLQVCEEFADGSHMDRLALAAAVARGLANAERILAMGPNPPPAQAAAGVVQRRLPYADD